MLYNILSQIFIVKCFTKSLLIRTIKIIVIITFIVIITITIIGVIMVIITITTNQCLDVNVGMLVIWKYLLHTLKTSTSNKREELGGTLEGTPCKETHDQCLQ